MGIRARSFFFGTKTDPEMSVNASPGLGVSCVERFELELNVGTARTIGFNALSNPHVVDLKFLSFVLHSHSGTSNP
jgi:hypothetical protein